MAIEKCIPIKKELIAYMSQQLSDFSFQGCHGNIYAFCRYGIAGIHDYILIQREFYEGNLSLAISALASCFNTSWRGIPWFTIGYETSLPVLITGKKYYDASLGRHCVSNSKDQLETLFTAIKSDIFTYALPFFSKSHIKINSDLLITTTNLVMRNQLSIMNSEQIDELKNYLIVRNKEYSLYRKECRKNHQNEQIDSFDSNPLHPLIEGWLLRIQKQLKYAHLSKALRTQFIRNTTILFRDAFDFYGLK